MRKYLAIVLLSSIAFSSLKAQPYVPMLDSINIWNHVYHFQFAVQNPTPTMVMGGERTRLFTDRDTIIDSLTYKILIASDVLPTFFAPDIIKGYIREDTGARKIYFRSPADTMEFIVYDFSLSVGDSLYLKCPIYPCFPAPEGYFEVESIQLRNTASGLKREFRLEPHLPLCTVDTAHWLVWIEGIGSLVELTYWDPDFFPTTMNAGVPVGKFNKASYS